MDRWYNIDKLLLDKVISNLVSCYTVKVGKSLIGKLI